MTKPTTPFFFSCSRAGLDGKPANFDDFEFVSFERAEKGGVVWGVWKVKTLEVREMKRRVRVGLKYSGESDVSVALEIAQNQCSEGVLICAAEKGDSFECDVVTIRKT